MRSLRLPFLLAAAATLTTLVATTPLRAAPSTSASTSSAPADPSADGSSYVRIETAYATLANGEILPFEVHLPAAGSFARPVVLVIHGYATVGVDYSWIADHLASRGFAAALVETSNPYGTSFEDWATETIAQLDALETANTNVWSGLSGELDFSHLCVVGHSYGASTAIAVAARDARIKAVAAIEPGAEATLHTQLLTRAGQVKVPQLVIGGQLDPICPPATQGFPVFQATTSASHRLYVEITKGDHLGMLDTGYDPYVYTNGTWQLEYVPSAQEHVIASRYFTSWLETFALGHADPAGYTTGTYAAGEVKSGVLSRFSR